jgi:hypothetical protein
VHDLGTDPAFAHQHAAFHQILDRAARGRARDAEPFGEVDLVLDARADPDLTLLDELLETARDLEVEGHGAGPVDLDRAHRTAGWGGIGCHGTPFVFQFVMTKY